jgi:hypothetical protein
MPTSAKPKSPRGENGPGDSEQREKVNPAPEVTLTKVTADCENPVTQQIPDPVSDPKPAAAVAVEDSGNPEPVLSPADRKIADRMSREIANHLGLGGRSRSIRIDV